MAELNTGKTICTRCGQAYSRRKGYFPVSYAIQHKGIGYIPVCKQCVDNMYAGYLMQCEKTEDAVRQMCRKLDIYWNRDVFKLVEQKSTPRSLLIQYIAKINSGTRFLGKSYDDTLIEEDALWNFTQEVSAIANRPTNIEPVAEPEYKPEIQIPDEVIAFWGTGYDPEMYLQLEQRRAYYMSKLPNIKPGEELDLGTEVIIKQICSLELDINRDRAAGKPVDKSVAALNNLLGSGNLKPVQKKQDEIDSGMANTPMGVWLQKFEQERPLPEIDDNLKDVNGIKKYVFTWMGHLCKMLGLKNAYAKLYEDEIRKHTVEKPEYDGDDDEEILLSFFEGDEN